MKQSEPVNRQRNRLCTPPPLVQQMSGYSEIGMTRETKRLARIILANPDISPEEFCEALRTLGEEGDFRKGKPRIETAYNRQSRAFKRKVRPYMLDMYASLEDWENARRFISPRNAWTASEMFWSMEVLLAVNMLDKAKCLARRCKRVLPFAETRFDQSLLCHALASFYARTHQWEKALAMWEETPLEQPFRRNALSGIVEIHLARAFEAVQRGLEILAELKRNPDVTTELCLPGNDLGMTKDAEKELLKFKRGIEKLLPEEARRELGTA